MNAMKKSK